MTKSNKTRLCIVGTGGWSNRMHLPALKVLGESDPVEFVGVCDLRREAAEAYAKELGGAPVFTDLAEMAKAAKPDGMILIIDPSAAPAAISQAVSFKIPFFTEKPPSTDTPTHRRLIQEAGGLIHVVGYNRRHSPYILKAKEWMRGRNIQCVTAMFSRCHRMEADFSTTAVHGIDTTLDLVGKPLARARVEIAPAGTVWSFFINGWTSDGVRFDLIVTPNTSSSIEHYIIRGVERTAFVAFPQIGMIDDPGYVECQEGNKVVSRFTPKDFGIAPDDNPLLGGILNEHRAFVAAIRDRKAAESNLSTTLQTQLIREALVNLITAGKPGLIDLTF
jgi:predicted dehydrogenase